jgi:eukaryotic-like serine/threonine-protein kinase
MKICPQCGREYPDTVTLCPRDGEALESADDPLIGQVLAGKYRIEQLIKRGGMGAVYRGTHVLMDKKVAVKVLRPSLAGDEKLVARFSREAKAASRLSHPHALNVTDFGETSDGVVFLVMELLSGRTLKEVLRKEGRLSLRRVIEIVRQVGGALEAAHAEGVVHRDLKSENIMLLNTDGADYAKVLDFGIAKIKEPLGGTDPGLTSPELVLGTPLYMSPEQCSQSAELDARSDIYSLGVIIFELLAGHVPFNADSSTTVMMKHLQEAPPSILDERPDLPARVGRVISRALAKRPEERFQTVRDLIDELAESAAPEPAAVSVPSLPARPTHRIVIPAPGMIAAPAANHDEETVVQPRMVSAQGSVPPQAAPPVAVSFNPWRIMISTLAGLVVLFIAIYALTRSTQPDSNANHQTTPSLAADPGSRPVQPASPPTGDSEAGVPLGGTTTAEASPNVSPSPSPTASPPIETVVGNANSQSSPSPTPAASPPAPTGSVTPLASPAGTTKPPPPTGVPSATVPPGT